MSLGPNLCHVYSFLNQIQSDSLLDKADELVCSVSSAGIYLISLNIKRVFKNYLKIFLILLSSLLPREV